MTNLLASLKCSDDIHLIIGASNVASLRINSILEAGAKPILISNQPSEKFPKSIQDNIAKGNLKHIEGV